VQFRVHCSKGTYIRTLVNDLGLLLKAGAHLTSLERLACGAWFHSDNSVTIEKLKQMEGDTDVPWISPLKLLDQLYTVSATSQILTALKYGRRVEVPEPLDTVQNTEMSAENEFSEDSKQIHTKVLTSDNNLVAIGYLMWEDDVCYFQPSKVFI
jgi:tRNA U55 pseudouridine synthase TruB